MLPIYDFGIRQDESSLLVVGSTHVEQKCMFVFLLTITVHLRYLVLMNAMYHVNQIITNMTFV